MTYCSGQKTLNDLQEGTIKVITWYTHHFRWNEKKRYYEVKYSFSNSWVHAPLHELRQAAIEYEERNAPRSNDSVFDI